MRKLNIDWEDLTFAFESSFDAIRSYLDLETGKVVNVSSEVAHYVEEPAKPNEQVPDWMQQDIDQATQVEEAYGTRYIAIPASSNADSYNDMLAFINRISHPQLRSQLERAIHGPGAFRRFKDVLENYQDERKLWFTFRDNSEQQRLMDWLRAEEIEPLNPPVPAPLNQPEPEQASGEHTARLELIEELTILLLYLCSWEEKIATDASVRKAWKGYTFAILNTLQDRGLIHQSRNAKSVTLTEEGVELARELERRYSP